ncbi:uncharacterized protein MONBRDRAFT_12728 [Monosiga brevicollis MX1]|uniref:Malectin domain-containing protein n=1 Tax=Monosiga brevicollis TaxID=81824 RepID=A9VD51_MONBE|nr:uncharacterized protein MONBRDRAFT_12728 [Monosiga brevicollis MX1]EDQ84539.1 predicted protein [Monosiga brevicollis MX1]|eukprot:XP_001750655.1 hypothetical protein [Monosiga brevicollis MX1]
MAVVGALGHVWNADAYFNTGYMFQRAADFEVDVSQTGQVPALYQSERYFDLKQVDLVYNFPVSVPGKYLVELHFAEICDCVSKRKQRRFHVRIEGKRVEKKLDLFRDHGWGVAIRRLYELLVKDNAVTIQFQKKQGNPKISAIAIYPPGVAAQLPTTPLPVATSASPASLTTPPATTTSKDDASAFQIPIYRINCGGLSFFDSKTGHEWYGDLFSSTGKAIEDASIQVTNNGVDRYLYQTYRRGTNKEPSLVYNLPAQSQVGEPVMLLLHFLEFCADCERTFHVYVGQTRVAKSFRTMDVTGIRSRAVVVPFFGRISDDGMLQLRLEYAGTNKDWPLLMGIELYGREQTATQTQDVASASSSASLPAATSAPAPTTVSTSQSTPAGSILYRINAGGHSYSAASGAEWQEDNHFGTGVANVQTSASVPSATEPGIYQSARVGDGLHDVVYQVPIPIRGIFTVELYFAETCDCATHIGDRVFGVTVEGLQVASRLDLVAAAGWSRAFVLSVMVEVTDGMLNLILSQDPATLPPVLNGLQIAFEEATESAVTTTMTTLVTTSTTTITTTTTTTRSLTTIPDADQPMGYVALARINCGSTAAYVDSHGRLWNPDYGFVGGTSFEMPELGIANTRDPRLFQSERYGLGTLRYEIPVPAPDLYFVRLHFADICPCTLGVGSRIFKVCF